LELLGGIAAAAAALTCFVFFGKTGEVEWHKSRARHHEPLASLCKTSAPGPQATRPLATPKARPLGGPPLNPNPGSTLRIVVVEVQVLIEPHVLHARKGGLAVHDPLLLFLGSGRLWLGCLGGTGSQYEDGLPLETRYSFTPRPLYAIVSVSAVLYRAPLVSPPSFAPPGPGARRFWVLNEDIYGNF